MADFIAVIRRAVDGLSNNTPEMRARVYEKARAAVVRQLENMSPRPPEHMLQRQLDKLDAAIREVEAEHADALPPLDEAPEPSMPAVAGAAAATAASAPAWAEQQPEHAQSSHQDVAAQEPVEEVAPAAEPVEPPQEVSGDDWADAHMAEPAAPAVAEEPAYLAEETVPPVEEALPAEPVEPTSPAQTAWQDEPVSAREPETDYTRLYEHREDEAPAVEPEPQYEPTPEVRHEVETVAAAATYGDVPTAEETWSRSDEPETSAPAWDAVPAVEAEPVAEAFQPADASVEAEPYHQPQAPEVGVRVDSVEDWLQSRALDPAPTVPSASWDLPAATETAANRVPELPEIDTAPPAVSYTPTDEFPAYEEPVHVEASGDYVAPEGLSLPDADPVVLDKIASSSAAPAIDADDFSQWFQENVDQGETQKGNGDPASASAVPAASEWDEHIDSFAPSAKGAQVEVAGQADGMEALVGGYGQQPSYRLEPKKRRNPAPIIVAALVLVVLGAGGYLAWSMRDQIGSMVANLTGDVAPTQETADAPETTPAEQPQPPADTAAAPQEAAPTVDDGSQKFTQRLRPDGTEIDAGAGSAPIEGAPAEGRSVSAQTVASTVEPTDAPAAANGAAATQTPGAAANTSAVAGGEKLFLYEERIGQATPVAVPGSITWSAVRENGADGRPDPQIQGRINVPERGISALLTFKRNTDNSLPASHIIEVVFSVPADFEGGAVENLQRIAMKRTEQDRGDPLVAVTAKVTDDTYLVALNDFEDVVRRNMDLLSTRGWIDIPVTYRNGRRALITLDKGTTGGNVFDQVIREWAALTPAAPAN
ncbi:hypothetical protein D4A92_00130 [Rhizobium rosettiformans]|uniref:Transcriptional regulator n=1 Tax=Rhizobium rosettiformans TaxID=1368430 RepID=A0ABX7ENZ8_9HYPH|nr:hypothetical protein [Rhizobium rosettiformans]QRF49963.1 hypothetical protein D4A92_00130 [Rhizobium rosettiformans]